MTYDEQFPNGRRYRRWQSVTHELAVRDSALLHYLTARFPHTKPLQDAYNATPRDRVVEPVPFYDSFIGAAFDHMIQMRFDSTTRIRTVEFGALVATGDGFLCFDALDAISRFNWQTCTDTYLAQCAYVYAIFTTLARNPQAINSAYYYKLLPPRMARKEFRPVQLLQMAPDKAIQNLLELLKLASAELVPALAKTDTGNWAAPVFDGSALIDADGDFISKRILFEFKTALKDALLAQHIYQLVCYLLLDFSDEYRLSRLRSTRLGSDTYMAGPFERCCPLSRADVSTWPRSAPNSADSYSPESPTRSATLGGGKPKSARRALSLPTGYTDATQVSGDRFSASHLAPLAPTA